MKPLQLSKSNDHKEELLAHQRGRHRWCISMMHQDSSSQVQKLKSPLDQARRQKESSFITKRDSTVTVCGTMIPLLHNFGRVTLFSFLESLD